MLGTKQGWTMAPDGAQFRRVLASPAPQRVQGLQPIEWLLAQGALIVASDVNAVYLDFGQPTQRRIRRVTPATLAIMQVCADGAAAL